MRSLSLCSGYGGLDLAVEAALGATTIAHAEIEPAANLVLEQRWPGVPNLGDIKTADWTTVDAEVLTAGYPCQPFSGAGRRKGADDDRHLWPFVAEAVRGVRPRYVVLENVAGHRTLGLDAVLGDLAADGYDAVWTCIRASDLGAPHKRERIFIVATDTRQQRPPSPAFARPRRRTTRGDDARLQALGDDLPTPYPGGEHGEQRRSAGPGEAASGRPLDQSSGRGLGPVLDPDIRWGKYETAIRRWERRLGRRAPIPTVPGPRSGQRLSARFEEWMMGLPDGWVTDVDGLTWNDQVKLLGNGVVPLQARAALDFLLPLTHPVGDRDDERSDAVRG